MILPTAEMAAARRRGYLRRAPFGLLALALIIASVTAPHVMVEAATIYPGRSLISASRFFLTATPGGEAFSGATSYGAIGFGISVTYFGLALQQVGALMGIGTFWVLIAEDVGRWVRRFAMASGILLTLSSATVVFGFQQLWVAGVPTLLGVAWLPTLLAGLTMMIGARVAKGRLSSTWFMARPEIFQP
jgi:hypothetical protein